MQITISQLAGILRIEFAARELAIKALRCGDLDPTRDDVALARARLSSQRFRCLCKHPNLAPSEIPEIAMISKAERFVETIGALIGAKTVPLCA